MDFRRVDSGVSARRYEGAWARNRSLQRRSARLRLPPKRRRRRSRSHPLHLPQVHPRTSSAQSHLLLPHHLRRHPHPSCRIHLLLRRQILLCHTQSVCLVRFLHHSVYNAPCHIISHRKQAPFCLRFPSIILTAPCSLHLLCRRRSLSLLYCHIQTSSTLLIPPIQCGVLFHHHRTPLFYLDRLVSFVFTLLY